MIDALLAEDIAGRARLHYATAVISYNQAQMNLLATLGQKGRQRCAGQGVP